MGETQISIAKKETKLNTLVYLHIYNMYTNKRISIYSTHFILSRWGIANGCDCTATSVVPVACKSQLHQRSLPSALVYINNTHTHTHTLCHVFNQT